MVTMADILTYLTKLFILANVKNHDIPFTSEQSYLLKQFAWGAVEKILLKRLLLSLCSSFSLMDITVCKDAAR